MNENQFFEEWKNKMPEKEKAFFIPDGIVNFEKWNKSKIKILFFLKEANVDIKNADSIDFDERDYLLNYNKKEQYKKTHSPTVDVMIQWIYAIECCLYSDKKWKEVLKECKKEQLQDEMLEQIAIVNAKKIPGGGTVNWSDFDLYMNEKVNIEFLFKQLNLYNPNIVICGKTAWILEKYGPEDFSSEKWKETFHGIRYLRYNGCFFVDYVHPNVRAPKNMVFYSLIDAIKEILYIK